MPDNALYAVKFRKAGGDWDWTKPKGFAMAVKDLRALKEAMNYEEIVLINWDEVLKGDI